MGWAAAWPWRQARAVAALAGLVFCGGAAALGVTYMTPQEAAYNALLSSAPVAATLGDIGTRSPLDLDEQKRIAAMPVSGPGSRAQYVRAAMRRLDLEGAYVDSAGNVVAERLGLLHSPRLVIAASLDAGDDARGLATLLAVLGALQARRMQTTGDIVFIAVNDGGKSRAAAALWREVKDIDGFVAIDDAPAMHGRVPAGAKARAAGLLEAARRAAELMKAQAPGLPVAGSLAAGAAGKGIPALSMRGGVVVLGAERLSAGESKEPQTLFLTALALTGLAGTNDPLLEVRPAAPVKAPALR
ncbi:MAG: peptidase [Betaproteobacteria bacterium]|nr:peptidase [Betaproteobacteria bacterium]